MNRANNNDEKIMQSIQIINDLLNRLLIEIRAHGEEKGINNAPRVIREWDRHWASILN